MPQAPEYIYRGRSGRSVTGARAHLLQAPGTASRAQPDQLHPVVVPQSMQTLHVPFCTMRELPQLGQVLPS